MANIAFDTRVARIPHGYGLSKLLYVAGSGATGLLLLAGGLCMAEGIVANAIQGMTLVLGGA
jgi:hypothetical protein